MGNFVVSVKELGDDKEGLEVTFQCSKEFIRDVLGIFALDSASELGKILCQEIADKLKEQGSTYRKHISVFGLD